MKYLQAHSIVRLDDHNDAFCGHADALDPRRAVLPLRLVDEHEGLDVYIPRARE